MPGLGLFDAGDAGNFNLSGAFQTGVQRCGNLIEFHTCGTTPKKA